MLARPRRRGGAEGRPRAGLERAFDSELEGTSRAPEGLPPSLPVLPPVAISISLAMGLAPLVSGPLGAPGRERALARLFRKASAPGPSSSREPVLSSTYGTPWGDEASAFAIAGHGIRIEGMSLLQSAALSRLLARFVSASFDSLVSVSRAEPALFRKVEHRGWSYSLDFDYGPSHTAMTGIDLVARLDWNGSLSGALSVATEAPESFHGAFENFLRVLVAHDLLLRGGALLHSAGVVDGAGARLFVGPSGAGKSTVARLASEAGRVVTSDDLNLVGPDLALWGSPFLGVVGAREDGSHPLLRIYRLEKGEEDSLRAMGKAETLATLLACSPFVNRSPHLSDRLCSNLLALVEAVPAAALTFRREGSFWNLLQSC